MWGFLRLSNRASLEITELFQLHGVSQHCQRPQRVRGNVCLLFSNFNELSWEFVLPRVLFTAERSMQNSSCSGSKRVRDSWAGYWGPMLAVMNLTSGPCLRGVGLLGLPFLQLPSATTVQDTVLLRSLLRAVLVSEMHRIWCYEWKTSVRPQRFRGGSLRVWPSLCFVRRPGVSFRWRGEGSRSPSQVWSFQSCCCVLFVWTSTLENDQGQNMIEEPSPSLFKSPHFYDIVFHWRSSLKNEVEIPKEIASISSRA